MVSTFSFSGSLVLLALFVAPGLLAIKIAYYFGRSTDQTDRLDATVASLLTSVFALSALYILLSLSLGYFPTLPELETSLTIPIFIHGYAALLSIASLSGMYYGLYDHHIKNSEFHMSELRSALSRESTVSMKDAVVPAIRGDERSTRQEVWDYVFDRVYSKSEVKIYLREGDEILSGEVLVWGDSPQRDLLLSPGTREELESNGTPDDTYRYISYQDISYIQFNEDLNKNDRDVAEREVGDEPAHPNPGADEDLVEKLIESEMAERDISSKEDLFAELGVEDLEEFKTELFESDELSEQLRTNIPDII